MQTIRAIKIKLAEGGYDAVLAHVYCRPAEELQPYRDRIVRVMDGFISEFKVNEDAER